jgi:hypothetical protein
MNISAASGILSSAAGVGLAQTKGAETERAATDSAARARSVDGANRSEAAEGIGEAHEDQQSDERDADGRRLWEDSPNAKQKGEELVSAPHQSKDATGTAGNHLDLTG